MPTGDQVRLRGGHGLGALWPSLTQSMMHCGASLPLCGRGLSWPGLSTPNPKALLRPLGNPAGNRAVTFESMKSRNAG